MTEQAIIFEFSIGDEVKHSRHGIKATVIGLYVDSDMMTQAYVEWCDRIGGFNTEFFRESDLVLARPPRKAAARAGGKRAAKPRPPRGKAA